MKYHINYYKNNDNIWNTNYKRHFVCFNCKTSWKQNRVSTNKMCIKCNKTVRHVGNNFRVPKKNTSTTYWKKLEQFVNEEHVIFEKPNCENIVCNNHKHKYYQGSDGNQYCCEIPFVQHKSL